MLPVESFVKMLMSDGLGDKLVQILVALLVIAVVCFAWWSTNITELPHYRTVFLFERRSRRRNSRSRLTTHIQTTSIGGTQEEAAGEVVQTEATNPEANKPPEASTSADTSDGTPPQPQRSLEDEELETIVQIMDADANEVRLRRLAYYESQGTDNSDQPAPSTSSQQTQSEPERPTVAPNAEEVRHEEPLMEHNYAEREPVHANPQSNTPSSIRIKLKYLNDELKLVDGRLEEQLGDFKRRHFQLEFSSNKLVRLIFNGQVLQPDTETLQSCGLFDNCVVHCLVHQQRNTFNENSSSGGNFTSSNSRNISSASQGNNQGRDWDLGNVLFAFVSIILGSAWYFRYEYPHLYNVTTTVALVAITGIFTIFLVGVYFPDPQPPEPRVERHSIST